MAEQAPDMGDQQNGSTEDRQGADTGPEQNLAAEAAKWKALARKHEAAAIRLTQLEESQKSEQQRLADRAAAAEQRAIAAELAVLRSEVAASKGLAPTLAQRLSGATREELEADADSLLEQIQSTKPPTKPPLPPADAVAGPNNSGGKSREPQDIFAAMMKGGA